jgi:antirestriction protein ArdC
MKYDENHLNELTQRMVDLLETGELPPWMRGWEPGNAPKGPWNPTTGKQYSGENVINLMLAQMDLGLDQAAWMTYKQAKAVGGQVVKGSTSIRIKKYIQLTDEQVAELKPDEFAGPIIKYPNVFHISQIAGLPEKMIGPTNPQLVDKLVRHAACEELIDKAQNALGITIKYDREFPFYQPSTDTIHCPKPESFRSADHFYATLLHEISHSTGHPSRLNRESLKGALWGTPEYAKEELVAETASYFMGVRLGIGHDPENHAAYLKHWIDVLKTDNRALSYAAAQAEKVCQYLGITQLQTQALTRAQEIEQEPEQERAA